MISTRPFVVVCVAAVLVASCASDDTGDATPSTGAATTAPAATEPAPPATEPTPATEPAPQATDAAPVATEPESGSQDDNSSQPADEAEAAYDFSAVSPVVQAFVDERGLTGAGLIIVHDEDGVIYHDHWGEFSEDRISLIASSSKMLTAGVLLRLQDDGLLDMDAPVADVAEWGDGNPDVTAAQLVSNSSGLVGLFPDPGFGPYICQYLAAGTLQDCATAIFTTPDDDADVIAPDTEFATAAPSGRSPARSPRRRRASHGQS